MEKKPRVQKGFIFERYLTGHIFVPGCALYPMTRIECPDLLWTFDLVQREAFYSHQIFITFEGTL